MNKLLTMYQSTLVASNVGSNLDNYTINITIKYDDEGKISEENAMLQKNYMTKSVQLVYKGSPMECVAKLKSIINNEGRLQNNTWVYQ